MYFFLMGMVVYVFSHLFNCYVRYNFTKIAQYKQLTLEEAEEKMNKRRTNATGYERWMMKAATNGAAAFGVPLTEPTKKPGEGAAGTKDPADAGARGKKGKKGDGLDDEEEKGEEDENEEAARRDRLGLTKKGGGGDDDEDGGKGDIDLDDDDIEKGKLGPWCCCYYLLGF